MRPGAVGLRDAGIAFHHLDIEMAEQRLPFRENFALNGA